jgi:hypothetical protein
MHQNIYIRLLRDNWQLGCSHIRCISCSVAVSSSSNNPSPVKLGSRATAAADSAVKPPHGEDPCHHSTSTSDSDIAAHGTTSRFTPGGPTCSALISSARVHGWAMEMPSTHFSPASGGRSANGRCDRRTEPSVITRDTRSVPKLPSPKAGGRVRQSLHHTTMPSAGSSMRFAFGTSRTGPRTPTTAGRYDSWRSPASTTPRGSTQRT